MHHGPQIDSAVQTLRYLLLGLFLIGVALPAHATALVSENKAFAFDKISPKGKTAIQDFRQAYREFLNRELSSYDPATQADITKVFEQCLDNSYADDLMASNRLLIAL